MSGVRYRIELSDAATEHLDEIAETISHDSPVNAMRFVARLRAAVARLDQLPLRGKPAAEGPIDGHVAPELSESKYRIIYIVVGHKVIVTAIRHQRRLPLE